MEADLEMALMMHDYLTVDGFPRQDPCHTCNKPLYMHDMMLPPRDGVCMEFTRRP